MALRATPSLVLFRHCLVPSRNSTSFPPRIAIRFATQSTLGNDHPSKRKQVTITNDTGAVRWRELSIREKVARTTQQTFNYGIIMLGAIGAGLVVTLLYTDVFAADSKTSQFNRAVRQVTSDPRCTQLLGSSKNIKAYGEPTWNKWTRNRAIASRVEKDHAGADNLHMHFNVEGPLNKGVVKLHMIRLPGQTDYEYKYLVLDVKGHPRIYLENADAKPEGSKKGPKFFGVRWR